jgi:ABC-type branched-subunit amino acid transport system permease subunit
MSETLLSKLAVAGAFLSFLLHVASFTQFSPLEMNSILLLILIGGTGLLWGGTRRVYHKLGVGLSFLERCSLRFAPRPARTMHRIILFPYGVLAIFFQLAVLLHGGKPSFHSGCAIFR